MEETKQSQVAAQAGDSGVVLPLLGRSRRLWWVVVGALVLLALAMASVVMLRVWHRRSHLDAAGRAIYEQDTEVHFAIGSGTRGSSFLSERDGYLFQSLISWYTEKGVWDLSPGAAMMSSAGRHVDGACLFCHAN